MDSRMTKTLITDAYVQRTGAINPRSGCCITRIEVINIAVRHIDHRKPAIVWRPQLLRQRTDGKFFGTLKMESLHHYRFATREQARLVIFEYIEVFTKNDVMRKSAIKHLLISQTSNNLRQNTDDLPAH